MARTARPAVQFEAASPLQSLTGLGPKAAEKLAARGLHSVQDLWLWLPRGYEDRTQLVPIHALRAGVAAQFDAEVLAVERGFRGRPMLKVAVGQAGAGSVLLRFFHFRAAQVEQFKIGARIRCFGTPRAGYQGLEIVHPSYRFLAAGDAPERNALPQTLDALYPAIDGINPAQLRRWIAQALTRLPAAQQLELLPAALLQPFALPNLHDAICTLHQPRTDADIQALLDGRHPAQQRLALEELLAHQLSLRRQRIALQQHRAPILSADAALLQQFLQQLPFQLTDAQQRVFAQIAQDMQQDKPMLRLVQGDVGSGKTVVAALAALAAVAQGKQAALMAPTELLAEQHLHNLHTWFAPLGVHVCWLAGKLTGKARTEALAEIADGRAQVVVGTHALMQDGVVFKDLALVIVDEQHRFGVHQRLALREKGRTAEGVIEQVPHQLVMTATPIPRTLAMSAYADLDVSAIDTLPPGRTPVATVAINNQRRDELIARIRIACAQGRQVYWVCTLIEENDELQAQAAETAYTLLCEALPDAAIGLVHGRMKPAQKQAVMLRFKQGQIAILVATTVIEVGVDVPNASLMVIENAERLGLAQLHQLRGRVGRGSVQSSCVLLYQAPLSAMAQQRIDVMRQTCDGFVIAEKDLELRGPGELLGTRQTGLVQFRIADLNRDAALLPAVQTLAETLLHQHPQRADALVARWIGSAARYATA